MFLLDLGQAFNRHCRHLTQETFAKQGYPAQVSFQLTADSSQLRQSGRDSRRLFQGDLNDRHSCGFSTKPPYVIDLVIVSITNVSVFRFHLTRDFSFD